MGVIGDLGKGDRLLVPELSRLSRSILEIMQILSVAKDSWIPIYAGKGFIPVIKGQLIAYESKISYRSFRN